MQVSQDQRKTEEHADKNWGPDLAGSRECEAWPTELKWLFEWVLIHHVGVAVGRQSRPRWKPSVMIDGCMSASEPFESAQPWSESCRRPPSIAGIETPAQGQSVELVDRINHTIGIGCGANYIHMLACVFDTSILNVTLQSL